MGTRQIERSEYRELRYGLRSAPAIQTRLAGHRVKRIREYIHQNLAEYLTILSMAKVVQSSPSHFIRAFTLTFGMPPHQYLTKVRLEKRKLY
ncbi:AraC family transcriptional regulator [Phyllobacterium sp. K27]